MSRNGLILLLLVFVKGDGGKYSEKANNGGKAIYPDEKSPIVHFGSVSEPFRMSRVNLLWEKARRAGLAEGKLERLYSKLKVEEKRQKQCSQFLRRDHSCKKTGERRTLFKNKYGRWAGEGTGKVQVSPHCC